MNIKKVRSNKREGFTLIEMVMVVVIIGVLSSMAMMKYGDVQTNAKRKLIEQRHIQLQLQLQWL